MVKLLLDAGADPNLANKDGETPLYRASGKGHAEVAKLLLEAGADPILADKDGRTPLYLAQRNWHSEVGKLLHAFGAHDKRAQKKQSDWKFLQDSQRAGSSSSSFLIQFFFSSLLSLPRPSHNLHTKLID